MAFWPVPCSAQTISLCWLLGLCVFPLVNLRSCSWRRRGKCRALLVKVAVKSSPVFPGICVHVSCSKTRSKFSVLVGCVVLTPCPRLNFYVLTCRFAARTWMHGHCQVRWARWCSSALTCVDAKKTPPSSLCSKGRSSLFMCTGSFPQILSAQHLQAGCTEYTFSRK